MLFAVLIATACDSELESYDKGKVERLQGELVKMEARHTALQRCADLARRGGGCQMSPADFEELELLELEIRDVAGEISAAEKEARQRSEVEQLGAYEAKKRATQEPYEAYLEDYRKRKAAAEAREEYERSQNQ